MLKINNMRNLNLIPVVLLSLILQSTTVYSAGDITYKNMEKTLQASGITQKPTEASYEALLSLLIEIKSDIETLENNSNKSSNNNIRLSKDDTEKQIKFIQHAIDLMESNAELTITHRQKVSAFWAGQRILYSVLAQPYVGRKTTLIEKIKLVLFFLNRKATTIPMPSPEHLTLPIGMNQAQKESRHLPKVGSNEFLTAQELSHLSPLEIAELDIGDSHPKWNTRAYMAQHPNPYEELIKWATQESSQKIRKKFNLKKDFRYPLEQARRVLFLDTIKDSATSPKVDTLDAFGFKWKLKWGIETQTEPFVNYLAASLGAKWVDLVFANERGNQGLVLVLAAKQPNDSCDNISQVKTLITCLKKSKYKFDLSPYIEESGIITPQNVDDILKNLASSPLLEFNKGQLIGRQYLSFKTSMVEFTASKILERGGPTAGSSLGAPMDRVARGLLLFNTWIANNDAKDENNKGFLIKDFRNQKEIFIESQHDMGSSLGSNGNAGGINDLKVNHRFISKHTDNIENGYEFGQISINQFMLYRPKAWTNVTYSDALWMAKQIASLPHDVIVRAAQKTLWPDFMQSALVYKMTARKIHIARTFDLQELLDQKIILPPDLAIDLSSPEQRKAVALKYDLNPIEFERSLEASGKLMSGKYSETILKKGQIASCRHSLIIDLMEATVNPEGLSRRQGRFSDHSPLPRCQVSETDNQ